ncbi:FAD:protein FMN transferase [Vibrio sp. Of7-15]|uniref:FAD:protein FMN transferase n=1 Tax=Vibrio sp. Of7-15 TaxID=2724879 RepID=UPI001EF259BD|nr:FAD:protein FMN transferase [Vibrio sp. Of7-15]MCG7499487.1 FAD:protein FMN transferase [Vibrio sp. Of7-15]
MKLFFCHLTQNIKRLVVTSVLLLAVTACGASREQVHLTGSTMGTYYSVKLIKQDGLPEQVAIQAEIDRVLELVNDQMSTYRKHSELSQFNQYQGSDGFEVSADTAAVVKESIRLNQLTSGALDVTVGPLVNLWGFGPEGRPEVVPTEAELAARRSVIGIEHLSLDGNKLIKDIPELYVDLSTIAKGWGVDKVADYLDSIGVQDYLVEIGGELRLKGKNKDDIAWRIAIEKPVDNERSIQEIVEPGDMAVATSGDYRNYFERDGVRYSHIINPQTGQPIKHKVVSVTVIAPTSMTADGLSTGMMVLGSEKALELANKEDIAVFMVVKTADGYDEIASEAFKPYLKNRS